MNIIKKIENMKIDDFQKNLICWFQEDQRSLPWREDKDPYKIWVSEIMLQQTKVDTVIPYFKRFIDKFPTVQALSEADEEKVLKSWEGLGYYSRVRNLHSAVKEVQEKYAGKVPDNVKDISDLKGVGPYTAGAILSIAYGKPVPAVDGNVMRVISRLLLITEDIAKPATRKIFEEIVRVLIVKSDPSLFNQALMELGALICTPVSPSCFLCPVRENCLAFAEGKQSELPVKSKKKKQRIIHLASVLLKDEYGHTLIHKRANSGLLANLWEFPTMEISHHYKSEREQLLQEIDRHYGAKIEVNELITTIEHVFSHLIWKINVYEGKLQSLQEERPDLKVVSKEKIKELPFPVPHQKILKFF
ncbi:A/G-specific adenine glycosylase [Bacillaceae bacterium Marseille-Q3522]|nr:A/G-specific adenine glycosylase [Bacillaceae bacterium Marseille-Q3522]